MQDRPINFGWVRDALDPRDRVFSAPLAKLQALPPSVDLVAEVPDLFPEVYDQGRIGSCTGNAIAGAVQFERRKQNKQNPDPAFQDFVPSRLFIYYYERLKEKTVPLDAGAQIRDGMKTIAQLGVCPEADWPYDDTPADNETHLFPPGAKDAMLPNINANKAAKGVTAISYWRINQSLSQLKGCLADGYPFVFGFNIYDTIYDEDGQPKTTFPLPSTADRQLGGHAVLAVGYDDGTQCFKLRNSWGPNVQANGYFFMPYAYLTDANQSSDFWTLRGMSK
jgi:C1A family cysteine protease